MKKLSLIFLFTLLFISNSNAQMGFGKLEDVMEVQEKTLLVITDAQSSSLLKKIEKDPEKYKEYSDEIDQYNLALKEAFTKTWTFSNKIEYITQEELASIEKDKSKKGNYAYFDNQINRSPSRFTSSSSKAGDPDTYSLVLGLTDQKKPVYQMMYATLHPSEADLTFIIQQFQNYLNTRIALKTDKKSKKDIREELKENANLLKTKTLLLDENFVDDDLKKNINEIYKFKYKLTSKEEIDKAILSRNAEIAYIRAIPITQQSGGKNSVVKLSKLIFVQYVISAEDGKILGYAAPSAMGLGGNLGALTSSSNRNTTEKDLEKIIKNID